VAGITGWGEKEKPRFEMGKDGTKGGIKDTLN
jgi:hypothetical protein